MSLTKKLVLAFLLVTMIPLGAIIGVVHHTFAKHAEEDVGTLLDDNVIQIGKSMDEFMSSCIRGMKDLAEDAELSSGDRDDAQKNLSRYIHSFPYFGEVMLVDAHGTVIASSSPREVGTLLFTRFDNTRHEFEQALHSSAGGVYISDLNEIPDSLRPVVSAGKLSNAELGIQMFTAVQDATGHTVTVLVTDIVTDPLHELLGDLKRHAPVGGSAYLLDKGDLVLMTTEQQAPLLSLHLDDVTGGSLRSPLDQNAVGYLVYKDAHGRKQMAGYSRLSAYGANQAGNWKLITLAPYQAILAPMTQSFNRMFGILLATLVGAAGLGLWLARRLANPILKLTESAKTIAAGRFDIRVAVTTRDEIGTLGDAFNLMAGTLQTEIAQRANAQEWLRVANNELEQRVEERTAQLMAEIDERKRAEVEMHYAKTAAESANRSKSEFLASMSHELRTPLNAILNISESLGEGVYGAVNDKQQRSLHTVSESGRHLLGLINDILDLSKIEAGKVELAMGEVTIRPLCEASLRLIREQALRKAQDVSLAIEDGVTVVQADERRLKQILVNLLSNAIKFTPDGGRVGLEVGAADGTIAFTVWDNGIGISPDNLKKLFKPFVQLDSKLSRQYAGTGLGLSLAQRMAALHKGRIEVESELETGSRFTVYLPGNRSNSDGRVARAKIQCVAAEAKKIKGEGPLVLLVEDTQANRECIGDYLLAKGFRLQFATNGLDAIAHASDLRPDIILMDIQMPGMDGFEAIRQLRENPELAKTPVIALTALAMEGDSERCLAAGATHYVSKPVALKELVATMRAIVNESAPNNGRSKAPLHEPGID